MRRVIKIGGSLLRRPRLARSIETWVDSQVAGETLAIVGGGEVIDAVRRLDQCFRRDPAVTHWMCVRLLRTTFDWLAEQLPGWKTIRTPDEFDDWVRRRSRPSEARAADRALIAVDSFYHPDAGAPLPETWATTTDAIAGWLAIVSGADEVALLKSCPVDTSNGLERPNLEQLARRGVVDSALVQLCDRLPALRLIDFREHRCP